MLHCSREIHPGAGFLQPRGGSRHAEQGQADHTVHGHLLTWVRSGIPNLTASLIPRPPHCTPAFVACSTALQATKAGHGGLGTESNERLFTSLVPRPRPAFHHLLFCTAKAGRGLEWEITCLCCSNCIAVERVCSGHPWDSILAAIDTGGCFRQVFCTEIER